MHLLKVANYSQFLELGAPALKKRLEEILSPHRFRHSQGAAILAVRLAEAHGLDRDRAETAALVHDAAKDLPPDIQKGKVLAVEPSWWEPVAPFPKLWHAVSSAVMARTEFGIDDEEMILAIRHHPTGHPSFGDLGNLLYVVDYCDNTRTAPDQDAILETARRDLLQGAIEVSSRKLRHLSEMRRGIHPDAIHYWNGLLLQKEKRGNGDRESRNWDVAEED